MALHAPSHHVPTPHISEHGQQLLRDLAVALLLALAVLVVLGAAFLMRPAASEVVVTQPEAQSLVDYRAGERIRSVASQTSDGETFLLYRAGQREIK